MPLVILRKKKSTKAERELSYGVLRESKGFEMPLLCLVSPKAEPTASCHK